MCDVNGNTTNNFVMVYFFADGDIGWRMNMNTSSKRNCFLRVAQDAEAMAFTKVFTCWLWTGISPAVGDPGLNWLYWGLGKTPLQALRDFMSYTRLQKIKKSAWSWAFTGKCYAYYRRLYFILGKDCQVSWWRANLMKSLIKHRPVMRRTFVRISSNIVEALKSASVFNVIKYMWDMWWELHSVMKLLEPEGFIWIVILRV